MKTREIAPLLCLTWIKFQLEYGIQDTEFQESGSNLSIKHRESIKTENCCYLVKVTANLKMAYPAAINTHGGHWENLTNNGGAKPLKRLHILKEQGIF